VTVLPVADHNFFSTIAGLNDSTAYYRSNKQIMHFSSFYPSNACRIARDLFAFRKTLYHGFLRQIRPKSDVVVFDFTNYQIFLRYQVTIAKAFEIGDLQVVWILRPRFLLRSHEFKTNHHWLRSNKIVLRSPRFLHALRHEPQRHILITDNPHHDLSSITRTIVVKTINQQVASNGEDYCLPFVGYPDFLARHQANPANTEKRHPSQFRISFIGNCDPSSYQMSVCAQCSLSRSASKQIVKSSFGDKTLLIEEWRDKEKLRNHQRYDILFVDSFKAGLNPQEYDRALSSSDFFLALPGIGSSLTHSLYESLYHGCIPILSSDCIFDPFWLPSFNCLRYHSEESLVKAISIALEMPDDQIEQLRSNAICTFRDNYDVTNIPNRVLSKSIKSILVNNI
jgi:hypothetical protein